MKRKLLFVSLSLFMTMTLSAQEARYGFKSAVVKKTIEMGGQKIEATSYIDDYGNVESAIMMNVIRTVQRGNTFITVDLNRKVGKKEIATEKQLNYMNITPEDIEKNAMKEMGEEEFLGKMCKKYSMKGTRMGQKVDAVTLIWKGLVLKSDYYLENKSIMAKEYVTEILEDVVIDPENFAIPADAKIEE